jgi:hypothetical protein
VKPGRSKKLHTARRIRQYPKRQQRRRTSIPHYLAKDKHPHNCLASPHCTAGLNTHEVQDRVRSHCALGSSPGPAPPSLTSPSINIFVRVMLLQNTSI